MTPASLNTIRQSNRLFIKYNSLYSNTDGFLTTANALLGL